MPTCTITFHAGTQVGQITLDVPASAVDDPQEMRRRLELARLAYKHQFEHGGIMAIGPIYAHLGGKPADATQEVIDLNLVDADGNSVTVDTSEGVPDNGVTTAKIADGAVTADKLAAGVIPTSASADKAGLVKLAPVVATVKAPGATAPALSSAPAAGDTVTKAEFDAVVKQAAELKTAVTALAALSAELKTQVNAMITGMRSAGQQASA